MQSKKWKYLSEKNDRDEIVDFSKRNKIPTIFSTLLFNRGITNDFDAKNFLSKTKKSIHNPFGMIDIQNAIDRILSALKKKEKIMIYGDYDVDGISAVTILYDYLSMLGADVSYYIPNREKDGYGINMIALNKISKLGVKLIISVDCGITSIGEVEFARAQGMDFIITDHHICGDKLPNAVAVIDPKREDSDYSFRELCGAGIAFKLVLALSKSLNQDYNSLFYKYVPYAAIATIADVVPLIDENRTIVDSGLAMLSQTDILGIAAIFNLCKVQSINTNTISFMLAPRLNSVGRIDTASHGVELLTTKDKSKADELAKFLDEKNQERRDIELKIFKEAMEIIHNDNSFKSKKILVLAHDDWHIGVVGIVASRICERYYKPCIMICLNEDKGKGSCRSIEEINIYDTLKFAEDYLVHFGGHSMAAGLEIKKDDISSFDIAVNKYANSKLGDKALIPTVSIDCRVKSGLITLENTKALSRLEPFGCANPEPVFSMHDMNVISISQIGSEKNHLRLQIKSGDAVYNCIGFKMGELFNEINETSVVDIAFTPEVNIYNNTERLQLRLIDVRVK